MIKLTCSQLLKPRFWIQNPLVGWPVWNCLCTIVIIAGLFLVAAGMCSAFLPGDCFAQQKDEKTQGENLVVARQAEIIPVPFVTLRNRTRSSDPSQYFGGKRGQMHAGICNVSLSPLWMLDEIADAAPFYIPDEKIDLVDIKEIQLEQLSRDIGSFPKKNNGNIVIYIHGYNVDFEKGCKRSAIFQRALGLGDRLILFSWPADGKMLKYTWDEADLEWSVPHMARFFEEVGKWTGSGNLDIVAHSLGARGALQALVRMAYRERVAPVLKELVFIAPDIDADVFRQELPLIQKMASRITVYASENDKPLKLSHEVHGAPRLGEAGDYLTVLKGVKTIDISNISHRRYSGHLYHLFTPEVIADLTRLLHTGEPTRNRPALQPESRNGLPYWRMVSAE